MVVGDGKHAARSGCGGVRSWGSGLGLGWRVQRVFCSDKKSQRGRLVANLGGSHMFGGAGLRSLFCGLGLGLSVMLGLPLDMKMTKARRWHWGSRLQNLQSKREFLALDGLVGIVHRHRLPASLGSPSSSSSAITTCPHVTLAHSFRCVPSHRPITHVEGKPPPDPKPKEPPKHKAVLETPTPLRSRNPACHVYGRSQTPDLRQTCMPPYAVIRHSMKCVVPVHIHRCA